MADRYNVVIAGGGVIGSAVACFLAMEPAFAGTIAVIEPHPEVDTLLFANGFSGHGCNRRRRWAGFCPSGSPSATADPST